MGISQVSLQTLGNLFDLGTMIQASTKSNLLRLVKFCFNQYLRATNNISMAFDCGLSGISRELPDQPKPKFNNNKNAMCAPGKSYSSSFVSCSRSILARTKLQQCHYISAYGTPLQSKGGDFDSKDSMVPFLFSVRSLINL